MTPAEFLKAHVGQPLSKSASPYGRWLQGTLVAVEADELSVAYEVRPELCNPLGLLHGGAIGGLMDDAIGMLVFSLGEPDFFITLSLNIDYLAVAPQGSTVVARAVIERKGRQLIHARCELLLPANEGATKTVVARGTSILMRNQAKTDSFWKQTGTEPGPANNSGQAADK